VIDFRKQHRVDERLGWLFVLLAGPTVLLLLALGISGCVPGEPRKTREGVDAQTLTAWRLPPDLEAWVTSSADTEGGRLTRLELAGPVDRVDWLTSSSLKHLSMRGSEVSDLSGLPSTLESLDLCNTPVSSLPALPPSLTELDLRYTAVESVDVLPDSLLRLTLGGPSLTRVPLKSSNLQTLEVELTPSTTKLSDLLLPESLHTLALRAFGIRGVPEGLPSSLDSLALEATGIEAVKHLNDGVVRLALRNNEVLERIDWPPRLRELHLDGLERRALTAVPEYLEKLVLWNTQGFDIGPYGEQLVTLELNSVRDVEWTPLPRLRALRLIDAERPLDFPDTLEVLDLGAELEADVSKLQRLSPILRRLTLRLGPGGRPDPSGLDFSGFQGLEELDIASDAPVSVVGLPTTLKRLSLRIPSLGALPELPEGLNELDLTGVANLTVLPEALPQGLKTLVLRNAGLSELPALPAGLETLDISGTGITHLTASLSEAKRLQSLILHLDQLSNLEDVPPSVTSLSFRSTSPVVPCPDSLLESLGW